MDLQPKGVSAMSPRVISAGMLDTAPCIVGADSTSCGTGLLCQPLTHARQTLSCCNILSCCMCIWPVGRQQHLAALSVHRPRLLARSTNCRHRVAYQLCRDLMRTISTNKPAAHWLQHGVRCTYTVLL